MGTVAAHMADCQKHTDIVADRKDSDPRMNCMDSDSGLDSVVALPDRWAVGNGYHDHDHCRLGHLHSGKLANSTKGFVDCDCRWDSDCQTHYLDRLVDAEDNYCMMDSSLAVH